MKRFDGRTVVVTGAGSGIGHQIASQFLADGAIVYAADIDATGCPNGSVALAVDVTDEASVRSAMMRAASETGRLDVVCNNAGIGSIADPVLCSVEEWDPVFAVNARGAFLGTKHALPVMLERGSGVIINTASAAGMIGLPDRTAYCASKGAVIALTKQVAVQYAATGVRCNCLCPGTVDSPWVGRLTAEADDPEAARRNLIARQPMGRLGQPAEIAAAVLYLASDYAAFMTGTELVIDGGIIAG